MSASGSVIIFQRDVINIPAVSRHGRKQTTHQSFDFLFFKLFLSIYGGTFRGDINGNLFLFSKLTFERDRGGLTRR